MTVTVLDTGDLIREVTRGGDQVRALRFTSDGDRLTTVAQAGVEEWTLDTGELTQAGWPADIHPRHLPVDGTVAALTRDGRYLAAGHKSGTITVHDLLARKQVGRLVLHGAITCLSFDGMWLLAGTANGDVTVADGRSVSTSAAGRAV